MKWTYFDLWIGTLMNQLPGKIVRHLMLAGSILVGAHLALAQSSMQVVKVQAVTETDAVHAGSQVKVAVLAEVASGYHINAHKPTLDYLIPTNFEVTPTGQFSLRTVIYPNGSPKKFPFSDVPLSVYEGKVALAVILDVAKGVPPGTYPLKAKLAYQACSDHACLPPTSVPVDLTLKVVPQNVRLKAVEPNVFERIKFE
jgi:thioredoxin:protein disulfide reductase